MILYLIYLSIYLSFQLITNVPDVPYHECSLRAEHQHFSFFLHNLTKRINLYRLGCEIFAGEIEGAWCKHAARSYYPDFCRFMRARNQQEGMMRLHVMVGFSLN